MTDLTPFIFNIITGALNAMGLFVAWRVVRPMPGPLLWFVGGAVNVAGMPVLLLGVKTANPALMFLCNALFVVGVCIQYLGILRYFGRRLPLLPLGLSGGLVLLVLAWSTLVAPDAALRVGVSTTYEGIVVALMAWHLRGRRRSDRRIGQMFAMLGWGLMAPLLLFRGLAFLAGYGTAPDAAVADLMYVLLFYLAPVTMGMGSLGLILMTMMRLVDERQHALSQAQGLAEKYRQLAAVDALTGAMARGQFMTLAGEALAACQAAGRPFQLLLLDLDHFKRVNDTYGHAAGDEALRSTVERIRDQLRGADVLGRIGGEEFAVALPDLGPADAMTVADRLRQSVGSDPVCGPASRFRITISGGLADARPGDTLQTLIERADKALYIAKRGGRNLIATEPEPAIA